MKHQTSQASERPGGPRISTLLVAILSFLFTYLFFLEYLPPLRRLRLPYDLPWFHYSLADYAFQSLRHGRLPEWDPTIYAGMPFAANIQAALFYPGTWIMFLANAGRDHLSYQSLEDLVLIHVWLAFILCYAWLSRRVSPFAAACGGGVYAYGGYLLLQLQHMGVVAACAWIPFGLLGIDEYADSYEQPNWRPLWKVVAASALSFLAGYTPEWALAAVCFFAYAAFRPKGWKVAAATAVAVGMSLLVSMVQLLPTVQLSSFRVPEIRYGAGISDPWYFLSYLVPNYYDFGMATDALTNPGREYLYLGAPGLLGLLLIVLIRRRNGEASAVPSAALLAAMLVVVTNPWGAVWAVIRHSSLLANVIRDFYFVAGISVAAALLAAMGVDRLLNRIATTQRSRAIPSPIQTGAALVFVAILGGWSAHLLYQWRMDSLARGWASAADAAGILILFGAGLFVMARQTGRLSVLIAAALLIAVGIDYKAQGTAKRFNATRENPSFTTGEFPNLPTGVYQHLRENSAYRVAVDRTAPFAQTLRHFGLATPMGFDPFLSSGYKSLIESLATFRSNWEFDISPAKNDALDTLGVRFFLTTEQEPNFRVLLDSPRFRQLEPTDRYFKVFEVISPHAPYGWTRDGSEIGIERLRWEPEHREFKVRNPASRAFYLAEQWNPGWSAQIDGVRAPIERWRGAFQSVVVPPGEHRVAFQFADRGLRIGAVISAVSLAALLLAGFRRRRPLA